MKNHEFVVSTFMRPTYCDCCSRLLWGLSRQGLQCTNCEANIHKSCQNLILVSCHGPSDSKKLLSLETIQEFKDFKEPLNLLTTTPHNFTRIISKIGPIVNAQEEILKILEWREPGKSSAVLLSFIFICLYPWLLCCIPFFYILFQLIKINTTKNDSQAQYMKNMQFIQNHMKMGSDLIDLLNEKHEILRDSKSASLILLYYIGVSIVLCHSVTFKYLGFLFKRMCSVSVEYYSKNSKFPQIYKGEDKIIKVFENQRWWAGLGWIPFLLKNERSAWSDETGTNSFSHIHDYQLPESFIWKDEEWRLNEGWCGKDIDGQGNA